MMHAFIIILITTASPCAAIFAWAAIDEADKHPQNTTIIWGCTTVAAILQLTMLLAAYFMGAMQ